MFWIYRRNTKNRGRANFIKSKEKCGIEIQVSTTQTIRAATWFCLSFLCCRIVTYSYFMQIIRAYISSILNMYKTMYSKYLVGKHMKYYLTLSCWESCDLISSTYMVYTQCICHFVIYGVLIKNGLLNFTKCRHCILPTHPSSNHINSADVEQDLRISNLRKLK